MRYALAFGVLFVALASCKPDPSPESSFPLAAVEIPPAKPAALPVPPVPSIAADPGVAIAAMPPKRLMSAAEQAQTDATGYVAWQHSRAENIDRLTELSRVLGEAVATLQAHEAGGWYRQQDVDAARAALLEMRVFLTNKGD
jgi:hypothetical protein